MEDSQRIIQAPASLVDYVVAHELTHLRHPDHTPKFWRALERVMPDYEKRKTDLRNLGPQGVIVAAEAGAGTRCSAVPKVSSASS